MAKKRDRYYRKKQKRGRYNGLSYNKKTLKLQTYCEGDCKICPCKCNYQFSE